MTFLVIGGTGDIGAQVVRRLVRRGHDCTIYARRPRRDLLCEAATVPIEEGDVGDAEKLSSVLGGHRFEAIFHLAATLPTDADPPRNMIDREITGVLNVIDAAAAYKVPRVVYASSSLVYGRASGRHGYPEYVPFSEEDVLAPASTYAATYAAAKAAGEHVHLAYGGASGVEVVVLRLAPTFCIGRPSGHLILEPFRRIVDDAAAGRRCCIESGGDERLDVVDAANVAWAFEAAADRDRLRSGAILNIASGIGRTLKDWCAAVMDVVPGSEVEAGPGLDPFGLAGNYRVLSTDRAATVLGYRPTLDLRRTIARYVADAKLARKEPVGEGGRG